MVTKSDSPVMTRFPADMSLPSSELSCFDGSPNRVSILMSLVMNIMEPGSAITISSGSSSTTTYCISSPKIS